MADFDITIGLEVHLQLRTESKMFCSCRNEVGLPPNTQVCPVCLALPGILPVINKKAVEYAIKAALALHCEITPHTKFDRKNYFYPDLPKGYQISQSDLPLSTNGYLMIETSHGPKKIRIQRLHMEEDAGKMLHGEHGDEKSYVDLNRVGVPLVEIVTAPDMSSPEEAYDYLRELKTILEYIEVSDCNMQEGNLRCDANVSVSPKGSGKLGTKVEIKNVNSINFIRKALEYEAQRQWDVLQKGGTVSQATYSWVEAENRTELMRSKEFAHDYRYFPEPDLGPLQIAKDWIADIAKTLPELPGERYKRLMAQYTLSAADARLFVQNRYEADYFEACAKLLDDPQEIANWIKGKVYTYLNEKKLAISQFPISPAKLIELVKLVKDDKINRNAAKGIFDQMIATGKSAAEFAQDKEKVSDAGIITQICEQVMKKNPKLVEDFKKNPNALNSLLGQVMRESKGRADAQQAKKVLSEMLTK